ISQPFSFVIFNSPSITSNLISWIKFLPIVTLTHCSSDSFTINSIPVEILILENSPTGISRISNSPCALKQSDPSSEQLRSKTLKITNSSLLITSQNSFCFNLILPSFGGAGGGLQPHTYRKIHRFGFGEMCL